MRSGGELSQTMAELLHRRDLLQAAMERGIKEVRARNEAEAIAKADHAEAVARAYLLATGKTVREKEAQATLKTLKEAKALHIATALRRSASEALHVLGKDLDCIAAFCHAYNRELKTFEG